MRSNVEAPVHSETQTASPPHPPFASRLESPLALNLDQPFRLMVDTVVDYSIFMLDPAGFILTWNRGAETIKGYKPHEAIGRHFGMLYPREAARSGVPARQLTNALVHGHLEDESWRIRKDGSQFWANAVITPLRDETGGLIGFCQVVRDATTRRDTFQQIQAAERSIREAHDSLHAVVDCSPDCVAVLSHDWTLLYGNRRTFECLPDFRIGKSFWSCFPAMVATPTEHALRAAMASRRPVRFESVCDPYQRSYDVQAFPSELGLNVFFNDITGERVLADRLRFEQDLREKRVQTLSHMAGGLAHEISNPLAIIHGLAANLATAAESVTTDREAPKTALQPQEILNASRAILKTADRAINILRGLRGFGRDSSLNPPTPCSIPEVLDQCIDRQQTTLDRNHIEVRVKQQPGLPPVLCREIQIDQIITNLLTNAIVQPSEDPEPELNSEASDRSNPSAAPNKPHPRSRSNTADRWISLTATATHSGTLPGIVIDVADSGPPVEQRYLPHLLHPLTATMERGFDLGISLCLSRAIAQDHGGSLLLRSDTLYPTFRLFLPLDGTTGAVSTFSPRGALP